MLFPEFDGLDICYRRPGVDLKMHRARRKQTVLPGAVPGSGYPEIRLRALACCVIDERPNRDGRLDRGRRADYKDVCLRPGIDGPESQQEQKEQ